MKTWFRGIAVFLVSRACRMFIVLSHLGINIGQQTLAGKLFAVSQTT